MLKTRIIPCLDVNAGRVVKGVNFVDLIDAGDPVEQAIRYNNEGADELCFLDITATSDSRDILYNMVEKVAKNCFIPLTIGGGIREVENIRNLLNSGADKISINSAAIKNPDLISEAAHRFGSQCVVIAIDAKRTTPESNPDIESGFEIYTHGGRKPTGIDALKWAKKMAEYGAGEILLTSMDRDGTKIGFDNELTSLIANNVNIPVIASGGVGKLDDFVDGVKHGKASALLAASVFHFGELTIKQVKQHMHNNNIAVRLD